MTYSFVDLKITGLIVGALLLAVHLLAALRSPACMQWLKKFPRSRFFGTILITIAGLWSVLLVRAMDLGEFSHLRGLMIGAIIVGAFLAWRYMEEFLAVRALGMIALLAAEPILEACFLRPEQTHLLLTVLAYAWIILGLFWVGMPWTLRDQITWATARLPRFKALALGGAAYSLAILACAILAW